MARIPDSLAQRLKLCTRLPSPPPVALHVIELAQNPEIDLRAVADAVSQDTRGMRKKQEGNYKHDGRRHHDGALPVFSQYAADHENQQKRQKLDEHGAQRQ